MKNANGAARRSNSHTSRTEAARKAWRTRRAGPKKRRSHSGKGELIKGLTLAAGTYMVEVRSFYKDAGTGNVVYNSGNYSLTVKTQ